MEIRVKETGALMQEHEFRAMHPNVSGPLDTLYDVILEGPQATGGTVYQYSQRSGVEQINGQWFTKHVLGPVFTDTTLDGVTTTAAEHESAYKAVKDAEQATSVRASRAAKLAETDWRFRSDMTPSQAWIDYCQALRDISTQTGFPWSVTWPEMPA